MTSGECPVCLKYFTNISKTECNHLFCYSCTNICIKMNGFVEDNKVCVKCPLCREKIVCYLYENKDDDLRDPVNID